MKVNTKLVDPTLAEIDFLRCELDTGLTLSKLALDARRQDRRSRNSLNARKAYDTVVRFIPRVNLTPQETEEIKFRLAQLRLALESLGEFQPPPEV